jgi:rare lipoprotein A (peptidoglycan hydrolase)
MKKVLFFGLLGVIMALSGFSQQTQPLKAEGMGSWYEDGSGLFASHATLPFGTDLIITNTETGKQVTVQVGGRIPQDRRWIVEVSPPVADILEMYDMGFTPVRIEEVPKVVTVKALRATSVRGFRQSGRAMVLSLGSEFTAGHPSLSMGRQVRIVNRANNLGVVATVKNRVRASHERIIEISMAVAQALGVAQGTYIDVSVESVDN